MVKIKKVTIEEKDLNALCRQAGITRKELARRAGVNYINLTKAVAGKLMIKGENWDKIQKVLDEQK